ncbi:MAG TPA: hypothetical protein VJC16_00810 [Candidatus Nanoarchaeia archaeon]|nr:hypothetical protein [Candidatus Nanoarchaeia archaeon]
MAIATEMKQIVEKLDNLQSDITYIKKHLADVDSVLTDDDREALEEAEKDLKAQKTKRL